MNLRPSLQFALSCLEVIFGHIIASLREVDLDFPVDFGRRPLFFLALISLLLGMFLVSAVLFVYAIAVHSQNLLGDSFPVIFLLLSFRISMDVYLKPI